MKPIALHLTHNGRPISVFADSGESLLSLLRLKLGDQTPKYGCGQGGCGACSVRINGELRLACLTLAETIDGANIETVAALSAPNLDPLQEAFIENFAAQCGYCTPGMVIAARTLLDRNPKPNRDEVIDAISGNICRCTGYEPIIEAILAVAQKEVSA
ncbi:MAG: ferredoxin [Marinovum sp.]|nr:ferredoxin [Marinovum sp.]|tara:strand:+ start:533 stop:1006 length:474 start_codon:yes stop_codon:yes gene_type:complete